MKTSTSADKDFKRMATADTADTSRTADASCGGIGISGCANLADSGLEEEVAAYEAWRNSYLEKLANLAALYEAEDGKMVLRCVASGTRDTGKRSRWGRATRAFGFFPSTAIPDFGHFASDSDAGLNDWAMVGSDLYDALKEYNMSHPHDGTKPSQRAASAGSTSR
jgi:hypothetical protein